MDKDRLLETVKEWIIVDNEMKKLQKEMRNKREEKKELSNILVDVMRNNEIDEFDVNDGKLMYKMNKRKTTISKKHIMETLKKYFKEDNEKAEELTSYILESRKETVSETIKRKIEKQ